MSELINNSEKRKELLKHMILQLHAGEAPAEARKQLVSLLTKIPYDEVVEVEQELISEGLPESEVLRLCDIHSQALEGHIDLSGMKIVPPGHPVDTFKRENRELEKVVKELKEAQFEKRRLIKELAAKESQTSTQSCEATVEAGGVCIIKRDFGETTDADRMLRTASEIIKKNDATVTIFYGTDGKTCKLMVMAGEAAVKKGVNCGAIVKEAAPIMGGGGGGRPNFAQGGGTKPDKLKDAVAAAEEAAKKQVKA